MEAVGQLKQLRILSEQIKVLQLSEPFASYDESADSLTVKRFMERENFDMIGIRKSGFITGYVKRVDLSGQKLVDHIQKFDDQCTVLECDKPIIEALKALADKDHVFVSVFGKVAGIITRADLHKRVVSMWVYGLISTFEIHMLALIRNLYRNKDWKSLLKQERLKEIRKSHKSRMQQNSEIDELDCTQFCDKAELIGKHKEALEITGIGKTKWDTLSGKLERRLRNPVAHAQRLSVNKWKEMMGWLGQAEQIIKQIEKHLSHKAQV